MKPASEKLSEKFTLLLTPDDAKWLRKQATKMKTGPIDFLRRNLLKTKEAMEGGEPTKETTQPSLIPEETEGGQPLTKQMRIDERRFTRDTAILTYIEMTKIVFPDNALPDLNWMEKMRKKETTTTIKHIQEFLETDDPA